MECEIHPTISTLVDLDKWQQFSQCTLNQISVSRHRVGELVMDDPPHEVEIKNDLIDS